MKSKFTDVFKRHRKELIHYSTCDRNELLQDIDQIKEIQNMNRKRTLLENPDHIFENTLKD